VGHNTYSVPSRLKGERVRVRIYDDRLEVLYASQLQASMDRLQGHGGHRINYRHIIDSLVRKPGAFARYRYRDDLFPSLAFRRAYDVLCEAHAATRRADMAYLRLLHMAARTMESEVEAALELLLGEGQVPTVEQVQELVCPRRCEVPQMAVPTVDLDSYDVLLTAPQEVCR
jgi:hypothetical protein